MMTSFLMYPSYSTVFLCDITLHKRAVLPARNVGIASPPLWSCRSVFIMTSQFAMCYLYIHVLFFVSHILFGVHRLVQTAWRHWRYVFRHHDQLHKLSIIRKALFSATWKRPVFKAWKQAFLHARSIRRFGARVRRACVRRAFAGWCAVTAKANTFRELTLVSTSALLC